jgi:hypothetical protein
LHDFRPQKLVVSRLALRVRFGFPPYVFDADITVGNSHKIEESVVPRAGLEPALLAEPDFESGVSTNFTTEASGG